VHFVGYGIVRVKDKTWFGIGLTLLDLMPGLRSKPRVKLTTVCLIFAIGRVDLVWSDWCGEDKTSLRLGLILLDFCY
jgi:hypothetical protein